MHLRLLWILVAALNVSVCCVANDNRMDEPPYVSADQQNVVLQVMTLLNQAPPLFAPDFINPPFFTLRDKNNFSCCIFQPAEDFEVEAGVMPCVDTKLNVIFFREVFFAYSHEVEQYRGILGGCTCLVEDLMYRPIPNTQRHKTLGGALRALIARLRAQEDQLFAQEDAASANRSISGRSRLTNSANL